MDVSGTTHCPTDESFAVWEKFGVTLTSSYWGGVGQWTRKINGREENIYVITIFRLLITIFRLLIVYQKIP